LPLQEKSPCNYLIFLKDVNAFIVARALLILLVEPYLLARISLNQATAKTFLTAPQAIIHVHSEAGCNITTADFSFTLISYGTVHVFTSTSFKFFLASLTALAIESTTSQDFQVPSQILPLPSQITITALNLSCLPQEVTLVTLSIANNSSLNSFFAWNFHHFLFPAFLSIAIIDS